LSKVTATNDLAQTILHFVPLSRDAARVMAIAVVTLELLLGAGLLAGLRIGLLTAVASLLFAGFGAIMVSALLRGEEVSCHCFGALPFQPGRRVELALDLGLLDLSVLLGLLIRHRRKHPDSPTVPRPRGVLRAMVFLLCGQVVLVTGVLSAGRNGAGLDANLLVRFAEAEAEGFSVADGEQRLILIGDIREFGCAPCFDDFLALCDDLRGSSIEERGHRVALLMRHAPEDLTLTGEALELWASETGIDWAIASIPDSIASAIGIRRASAVLLEREWNVRGEYVFPLGDRVRREIVDALERE
jgi:uncharacterized membrane protein YphA (DoxX/SURF4 family)